MSERHWDTTGGTVPWGRTEHVVIDMLQAFYANDIELAQKLLELLSDTETGRYAMASFMTANISLVAGICGETAEAYLAGLRKVLPAREQS